MDLLNLYVFGHQNLVVKLYILGPTYIQPVIFADRAIIQDCQIVRVRQPMTKTTNKKRRNRDQDQKLYTGSLNIMIGAAGLNFWKSQANSLVKQMVCNGPITYSGLFNFTKNLVLCGDCTEDSKDCIIENETGYFAEPSDFYEPRAGKPLYPPVTADLDVCIPSDMKIYEKDGTFKYICTWSPKIGCQILYPKTNTFTECFMCRAIGIEGVKSCPCKIPNGTIDKDRKKKSGSRQLYIESLHFMIGAAGLVLVGLKLCGLMYEL
nr:uncharacterized protein LOC108066161 [Drosophila takahashii]